MSPSITRPQPSENIVSPTKAALGFRHPIGDVAERVAGRIDDAHFDGAELEDIAAADGFIKSLDL